MTFACIGSYVKDFEKRVPLHPQHLELIPETLRKQIYFDHNYGANFGMSDAELAGLSAGVASREELMMTADTVVLLKPVAEDFAQLKEGALLWGWPHSVQQTCVAEMAISKKLTIIAMERMYPWGPENQRGQHIFYKNGELAGVAGVHHAFNLVGFDGHYGPPLQALVIGTGSSSRGAIRSLKARGVHKIKVVEIRPEFKARDQIEGCDYYRLNRDNMRIVKHAFDPGQPIGEAVCSADIVINAVFQDPNAPLYFLRPDEVTNVKRGALILDISCDEGMGFPFSKPTDFDHPLIDFGHFTYYGVDHIPTLLWKSASWEVSQALFPYLEPMIEQRWRENIVLSRSVDFDQGVIKDPAILRFQNRSVEYPHPICDAQD